MARCLLVGEPHDVDGYKRVTIRLGGGGDRRHQIPSVEDGGEVGAAAAISLEQRDCGRPASSGAVTIGVGVAQRSQQAAHLVSAPQRTRARSHSSKLS